MNEDSELSQPPTQPDPSDNEIPSEAKIADLEKQNLKLKSYLKADVKRRKELEVEVQHQKDQLEAKDLRLQNLENIINETMEEKDGISKELETTKNNVDELTKQLSISILELNQSKIVIKNLQDSIAKLNSITQTETSDLILLKSNSNETEKQNHDQQNSLTLPDHHQEEEEEICQSLPIEKDSTSNSEIQSKMNSIQIEELENELKVEKEANENLQNELTNKTSELDKQKEVILQLQEIDNVNKIKMTKLAGKVITFRNQVQEKEKEINELNNMIKNTLNEKLLKFEFQMSDIQRQLNEKEAKIETFSKNVSFFKDEYEKGEQLTKGLQEQVSHKENKIVELKAINLQLQQKLSELNKTSSENLEFQSKFSQFEQEFKNQRQKLQKMKEVYDSVQNEKEELRISNIEKDRQITTKDEILKEMRDKLMKLETERNGFKEKARRSEEERMVVETENQKFSIQIRTLMSQNNELKQKVEKLDNDLIIEKSNNNQLNDNLIQLQSELQETESALLTAENEIRENSAELAELRTKCESHKAEMQTIAKQKVEAQNKLKEIQNARKEIVLAQSFDNVQSFEIPEMVVPTQQTDNNLDTSSNASFEYIQKLMLHFFNQDDKQRELLVPVILEVLGCDKLQIQKAQKSWKNSNKSSGFRWF